MALTAELLLVIFGPMPVMEGGKSLPWLCHTTRALSSIEA
jgi:hypothetical protein